MTQSQIWLGVDLGNARVGIALSDPDLLLAYPQEYISVSGDYFYALEDVIAIIEDKNISHVIVGYPLQLDGSEGKSAKKARRWAGALEKKLQQYAMDNVTVKLQDERLSSVAAHNQLLDAGLSMKQHRSVIDSQAAVILLQSALDDHKKIGQEE
ncbi:Holliday junction resolvase RuvX [Alloscardovia theropitheci]|uniref:Putative pre-16S rRNA nuclease n=1 Tax=Alloscardovia theropitheci TaxID=2496842 RepID=A0A4R0QZ71_9BIFI|nr:Holliday junction resolvase RuvX [Alloscardovia theropitheci]TCD55061.1 Holliday junction resolvase RuvX [Alloscardovia theropitheci]